LTLVDGDNSISFNAAAAQGERERAHPNEPGVTSLAIDAHADTRSLVWRVVEDQLRIWDAARPEHIYHISHANMARLSVTTGAGGNDLLIDETTLNHMEVLVSCPSLTAAFNNTLRVVNSVAPILVNGTIDELVVAPVTSRAMVAVSAPVRVGVVRMEDERAEAPVFTYDMDSTCLNSLPFASPRVASSQWMCGLLQANGFQGCRDCSLQYRGLLHFSVRTGPHRDSFTANGVSVPVSVSLGDGSDYVSLHGENMATVPGFAPIYTLDLGKGSDRLALSFPSNGILLDLGKVRDHGDFVAQGGAQDGAEPGRCWVSEWNTI
jgi:hypothetical protein